MKAATHISVKATRNVTSAQDGGRVARVDKPP